MTSTSNPGQRPAGVAETHAGIVFFVGDRAFKAKKPVAFSFLDFTRREQRKAALERELELNRRLAPDVYIRVLDVVDPGGDPVEHVLEMRRMPEETRLSALARSGRDVTGHIDEIADRIAAFHARAETGGDIDAVGAADVVLAHWRDSVEEMRSFAGGSAGAVLDPAVFEACWDMARRYVEGRKRLFDARITSRRIRDGHGDLLCDDIFCLPDGVRILDCIEFDDKLRWGDVISDIAFLAMDLERIGAAHLGLRLLARYRERSGDDAPASLVDHYVAYRAHVRSKIAALRFAQGDTAMGEEAERLLEICRSHLEAGRVRAVLVGGEPGTGKSTVAAGIAGRRGWQVLRSDVVRKELAGIEASDHSRTAPYGEGIYGTAATARTYEEMLRRTRDLVAMGESVMLDATWSGAAERDAARRLAAESLADLVELRCVCEADEARRRISSRLEAGRDASDADEEIARRVSAAFDPWPEAAVVDTSGTVESSVRAALASIA